MTNKGSKVLRGFTGLNNIEREDFIKELNKYLAAGNIQRQELEREIRLQASVGPKNSICDCCGR